MKLLISMMRSEKGSLKPPACLNPWVSKSCIVLTNASASTKLRRFATFCRKRSVACDFSGLPEPASAIHRGGYAPGYSGSVRSHGRAGNEKTHIDFREPFG